MKRELDSGFDDIFREYYSKLCFYSFKIIEDLPASEDLVQDIFINYWHKKDDLLINTSLNAYLYRSTHNACLNFLRKNKTIEKYQHYLATTSEDSYVEDRLIEHELSEKINSEINNLPERTSTIFKLSRNEKLKYKEIAEKLNISIKTVESHISRALRVLTIELNEYLSILLVLNIKTSTISLIEIGSCFCWVS